MIKIAILGATGHIAKNLIYWFSKDKNKDIYLFSRDISKLKSFIQKNNITMNYCVDYNNLFDIECYDLVEDLALSKVKFDVIINCIGKGDPQEIEKMGSEIFFLTEEWDNKILEYLKIHPKALYINFSSGVVHTQFDIDNLSHQHFYEIAKINSEAKHRALPDLNIVDLRLYGFFSRFTDLNAKFFMSALMKSIKNKTPFTADRELMVRDYINPKDLCSLIDLCIERKTLNGAFDTYSLKPVEKQEILNYFKENYDLNLKLVDEFNSPTTVNKSIYYSETKGAYQVGYFPKYTSMDTIKEESKYLLS